jgi:hypothetical protein
MAQKIKIEEFWSWFGTVALSLAANVENPLLLQELDRRVLELDSDVSWEIGPGANELWQFVISPNLDLQVMPKAQEIISFAPVLKGWEFYPGRRPKDWDFKLNMERSDGRVALHLDASEWEFVLLRYPDGRRELLLRGDGVALLDDDERWQAAAITLESILGEDVLLNKIDEFELLEHLEPRFAEKSQPIGRLREVVLEN